MPSPRQVADVQYSALDGTPLHRVGVRYSRIEDGELTPEAFDAPLFGDATTALQDMFAEIKDGDVVRFRRLHDCSAPLYTAANNVSFVSDTPYSRAGIRGKTENMQIVTLGGYGNLWEGPTLIGDGTLAGEGAGSTIKGLAFIRADGSKDVDAKVLGGTFYLLHECIRAKGANLRVTGTDFSTSFRGVVIEQNGEDECRGHVIKNNRFHSFGGLGSASKCIVLHDTAFSCEITDNYADAIYTFFEGPVNNTKIDNNNLFKVVAEAITLRDPINSVNPGNSNNPGGWQLTGSVSGNTIYKNSPGYFLTSGMSLRQLRNGKVIGNTVIGPRAHGIALYDCTSNVISGNVVVSHNYVPTDAGFAGIYGDDQSIGNNITSAIIRSAGIYNSDSMGISVHADNVVELCTVDPVYGAKRYPRAVPTLGIS